MSNQFTANFKTQLAQTILAFCKDIYQDRENDTQPVEMAKVNGSEWEIRMGFFKPTKLFVLIMDKGLDDDERHVLYTYGSPLKVGPYIGNTESRPGSVFCCDNGEYEPMEDDVRAVVKRLSTVD